MFGWWRGRPRLHGRRAFFGDAGRTTCRVGGALDRLRPASSRASLIWLRPRRRERRAGGISGACGNRADRIRPRRRANSRPRHRQALRISPIRITGVTSVFAVARAMPVRIRECGATPRISIPGSAACSVRNHWRFRVRAAIVAGGEGIATVEIDTRNLDSVCSTNLARRKDVVLHAHAALVSCAGATEGGQFPTLRAPTVPKWNGNRV